MVILLLCHKSKAEGVNPGLKTVKGRSIIIICNLTTKSNPKTAYLAIIIDEIPLMKNDEGIRIRRDILLQK